MPAGVMDFFATIVNGSQQLTVFTKNPNLDTLLIGLFYILNTSHLHFFLHWSVAIANNLSLFAVLKQEIKYTTQLQLTSTSAW